MRIGHALAILFPVICPVFACGQTPVDYPIQLTSLDSLAKMRESQLAYFYENSPVGEVPQGYVPGLAIFNPGSRTALFTGKVIRATAWQGKYFDEPGKMTNRVFGRRMIQADIVAGPSWLDGKPSIILDYAEASNIAKSYRDEIREISPGIYLGIMFRRTATGCERVSWFGLDARSGPRE
jgi:hypothetical protein